MFAPKGLKSDKGQDIDRGRLAPDGSSSEFSEDDTPLAVRLNSQGSGQPKDVGKQRPRAALSKKGGFVIPRKKKQANELLQVSNFNAREGKELLRHVTQSYRDTTVGATFKFEKLELVHNDQLSREFQDKKQHMRNDELRNARELEDKFAFLYTVDRDEAKKICEVGLEVGSSSISCLGDPSMGVYLCRHADVISKKPLLPGVPGYLIVFKVIKGKVKPVTERSSAVTDLLEPWPNFNCHVSRSLQSLPANSPLSLVFEYSQYYFYEYAEEGDNVHVKRPRQCLPYALLTFTMVDASATPQEPSVLQEEPPTTDNNGFLSPVSSTLRHETRIPEKRRGRSSHVIWMGVVANKDRILAEAQLVCHCVLKIKPPFEIGEKIVMKEKISFQQLRQLLTFPLFHSGPPSVTKVCQASLAGGTSFLHCDLLPVEDDCGKIQKLVKFFQEKKWAGIVKCPDANRVIFLIPTSQITLDLGITTVDSPAALHVLLYVKNQKSNKVSGINKAVTSGTVREKELRDVNQIQKELKRQLSHQVELKEKPTEHRRLSQDFARPAVTSASSSKVPRDVPEFALQSNEQAVQWKNAVENWLSRPHPLGGIEADLQKAVASSLTHVPKPRVPMAETPLNIPLQAVHSRSSGSTEQYRVISGQQDAVAKSNVSAEEYKVISGRQDGSARFSVSTEEHKVISGQQDGHARLAGNAEQHRLFVGEHSDIISRQVVKQDNIIKKGAKPSVTPVIIRKEEHREDPRLKITHSLDEQIITGLKSPNLPQISHGTPYNAEEALQAQGVKLESTSITPVIASTTPSTPQLKYQVDDKSIKELLDKINVQKKEESTYKVALDDGTRRALEVMKQQGAKKSKPELPEAKMIVMDANSDGKLDTEVCTRDDKSVKRGSTTATAAEENVKRIKINNVNPVRESMSIVKGVGPTPSSREEPVKHGEKAKGVRQPRRQRSEKKPQKISHVKEPKNPNDSSSGQEPTKSVMETAVPELSEAPFPKILSPESLKSPLSSFLMIKAPKVKLILSGKDSKDVAAQSHGNNRNSSEDALAKQPNATEDEQKGDLERDRKLIVSPVKGPLTSILMSKAPKAKLIPNGKDSQDLGAQSHGNNRNSSEDALTKQPNATEDEQKSDLERERKLIDSPVKSPPTSILMSKAPKVKLILSGKDSKDLGAQSHGNNRNSSEDALAKQPNATEDEQKGDLERDRKLIDSPVSMDISPQSTTPSLPESVSPITVVSSKGRYQMAVTPTATPTTTVHSAQSYPTPVSSSFPFIPPLPEGPYRSTVLPQPVPPPPGQQPVHPMPFVPPLPTASSSGTTPSLSSAPPSFKSPTVSSTPSGGSLPCNLPFQDVSSFVPHSAVLASSGSPATSTPSTMGAFAGSPSYPPPPSAHPASVQRNSSIDALPSPASSSAGQFPTPFPGQQWTGALSHSQGFVFPTSAAPPPRVAAIPPTEVLRWPARPGLPRPVLPPGPGRPLHTFPQQLVHPPQTTLFQGSPGEIPVRQPQGGGFVPNGVPSFHIPPVPPARTAQITPVRPMFGTVPLPPQFQPHLSFPPPPPPPPPPPFGYWVAPLKPPAVYSGKTTGYVGRMTSHSPTQKHAKELQQTSLSLSQKIKDPSIEKAQNENREQNKENSNNASSEGAKGVVSVEKQDDKEKSNAQLEKQREVAVNKLEVIDVHTSKDDKVVTATSNDKKVTASTDKEIKSEAVEESLAGSTKQLSRHTDDLKVQDSEAPSSDQTLLQEPLKPSSKYYLASDSSTNKENQIAEGQPGESNRDDSTKQRSKGLQVSDVADSISSKVCTEVEEPSQMPADEFKYSSSPVTSELSGNFGKEHIDVSVSGNIVEVEIDCLPTITYETEAERKGSKAKSKIYDILRQNAQQTKSETDSADQEEFKDLDDPDKPDNPELCAMDEDLNADDEGIAEEEKLLFSGEESTAGEQAVHLDSGLRVVQLLELDKIHVKDNERDCEESLTLGSNVEHKDGQPQEGLPSQLPSQDKQHEMIPRDSEFEDISDVSDEGTPERDLPGFGSVDIEQLWSSKAVDTAVPVSEAGPIDTVHSTVPVLEAAPVGTVDRTVPVSEAATMDTAESAPELLPKAVSKPKAEVVHNEADSSSSTTKKHNMRKRYITVQSQKRKRLDSTSEDTDANKYSSSSKRSKTNTHSRSSRRKSPDRHETGSSSRKGERARRTSKSSVVKSNPTSRRIVSGSKGGSLQITILRDAKCEETKVKEEEAISPETQKIEEKHPLADVEYSDLEDISPGRLSSDDESPATPPTPETAIPAMDFTHPSLGFWAAPLKTNEPTVTGSAVVEEHQVSGKEILAPQSHSSRLEEHPVNLEPSQMRYPLGEVKFYEDEPFIGQSSWPAEGFFCQTTTSEERDLVSQRVEKDPFLLDDSVGHYLSRSSQESEEDISRFPQSEVFEYGHGVRDHLQPQEKPYRSSGHAQSRGMQKEVKHRSTNRETRYPWKTHEESKHSQVPSAGGEGLVSASQSATGKNIGCDEESSEHTTKRHKVVKGAQSTNGNESVGDDARDWKIYVFASMKKPQFENWIRRKNFAAKLAGKCSVVLTPEQVRRSTERWYRRVKKQLRRTSHSSRPQTEDLETSDCVEFDFDDMDADSNCVKAPSGNKEQNCSSVSKESQQCVSVNVNNDAERCTVHSTHMEHHASPGTERSEVVHRHVNFISVDECNYDTIHIDKTDDLICDKEVSIILKQDETNDESTSNVGNNDAGSSVLGSVTSKLAEKNIPVKAEQCCDGLVEDQVTLCKEDDMRTSSTSEVEVGCIKQKDEAKESPVAEVLDESTVLHSDGEGNGGKDVDGENEVILGPGREEVIDGQGPSQEQGVADEVKSVREAEVIQAVNLSVNAQLDQGMEGTPKEVKEASLMHTEDTVAEDAKMDVSGSSQAGVLTDTAEVTDDHESRRDPASVAKQGIQEVENAPVHTDGYDTEDTKYCTQEESAGEGNKVESETGTNKADDKPLFTATSEPQTNIDGSFDKATVVLDQDKRGSVELGETNTTVTNRSPKVSSLVTGLAQFGESQSGSSIAIVSTSNQPKVLNLPALERPSLNAMTAPIVPVTSCFPAFQPFQRNLGWQVATHARPFTTTGIVPVHAPTLPLGNYGFHPSWVNHPLHAPIPVGCVRSHSTYDDICPPGTENISLEPSSDSADLAPGPKTQDEETSKSMVDKQLHESVMDNSVVTALMQFYSEIEEVEGSESNGVEGTDDTAETKSGYRVPMTVEESTQTKSSKNHDTKSDMEVESGREDSDKGVPEDEEMSATECVADSVHNRTESFDRASKLEGENREVMSTGTSTKQSQSTGGFVQCKVDISLVENRVDRTEVGTPVMMNPETAKDEILAKNSKVETEIAKATNTGITGDITQVECPNVTMNESLGDNPDNSMDITLSAKLDIDEIVAENGTRVDNANAAVDKTKLKKANDVFETILTKEADDAMNETLVDSLDISLDGTQMEEPCIVAGETHSEEPPSKSILAEEPDVAIKESLVDNLDIIVDGTQMDEPCIVLSGRHAEGPDDAIMGGVEEEHRGTHAEEPDDAIMEGLEEEHHGTHSEGPDAIMEGLEEEHSLSPIDPLFMASAEQTIFSSIGDLRNLLGQSSTFDRIAEEAIASTVSSLEDVLRQAHSSYLYHESSSCPSDSGVSVGEEVSAPSKSFSNIPVSTISLQDGDASKIGSMHGWSTSSCLSAGMQPQVVTAADARANDRNLTSYINKEKLPTQKKTKKPAGQRKFYFYVYSPEHDRECEAVKNYMLKAGGTFVDVKDSACLEENSRELKVFIRRKHLPAVHRLANLYQLKMLASVRFSLFNTLTDVIEGSRFYENIFVSGGALLADDSILKTIELDHLDALLRYLKEQSLAHQKFVWVLNISRNGYKKLSLNRPQTKRDSKVLNLIRQYREEGFITVLQKGYVAEGMPAAQRYLQTSLKLQIDLISVYRHVILLSDMDKSRMELPWFLERGIGVMNVREFLTTFAGEREASNLLSRRLNPEVTVKEPSTVPYCSTPEDETVPQTPEGTPMSDSSNDSPYTDTLAPELPSSSGAPQKRAVRSLSSDAGTMTHTRLHILSCVRSVRDNIRSQISSSSPSSPVSRSM